MTFENIKNIALPVIKKYGVNRAGIFGSFATGEAKEDSDIDMLVELPKGASLFDLIGLKLDLEELLGRKVDVLTYNSIYYLLREIILNEEIVIYEKRPEN